MNLNTSLALSTKPMSFNKETNTLSCEASDIRLTGAYRLYDDACDYGIWVRSHKTGKLEPFYVLGVNRDEEGDIRFWQFANTKHGIILTVYND